MLWNPTRHGSSWASAYVAADAAPYRPLSTCRAGHPIKSASRMLTIPPTDAIADYLAEALTRRPAINHVDLAGDQLAEARDRWRATHIQAPCRCYRSRNTNTLPSGRPHRLAIFGMSDENSNLLRRREPDARWTTACPAARLASHRVYWIRIDPREALHHHSCRLRTPHDGLGQSRRCGCLRRIVGGGGAPDFRCCCTIDHPDYRNSARVGRKDARPCRQRPRLPLLGAGQRHSGRELPKAASVGFRDVQHDLRDRRGSSAYRVPRRVQEHRHPHVALPSQQALPLVVQREPPGPGAAQRRAAPYSPLAHRRTGSTPPPPPRNSRARQPLAPAPRPHQNAIPSTLSSAIFGRPSVAAFPVHNTKHGARRTPRHLARRGVANGSRISRMTSIHLARSFGIDAYFQWVEAAGMTVRWTTLRVNRMMGPCGSISTVA